MKRLRAHDLKPEDVLRLTFHGGFDQQAALEGQLEPFFQALEKYADGWMPDVVEGKRQRKYTRAAIWTALEEGRDDVFTSLGLYRTKWPALDMTLWLWLPPRAPKLDIAVNVQPLSFFAEEERCLQVVELVRAWASHFPVSHAKAHSADDTELAGSPRFGRDEKTSRRNGFDRIYEVCWLNVFGPRLVETVGRERMLSTPAHRVEELPNGCVLLVTWPTVADFASKEARLAQARAHAHLRPDLDFDTVLRTLHERSARLAPVEPRFHPDLAPLLSRVVDRAASHERQRRIAELNAWQPPEPEEWRPAGSALPPDVDDPERTLEDYSTLAESLVALLHSEVPSVFDATPESLTDADFYFWREEFPSSRPREAIDEHAVPAIGAYLGEVLVRHLGGRWIPRRRLEETQVLVGNRVWLPFVRARNYMRSRQSLLDCSLTWLYRVAERHRG
ncbi:hypothetical protein ATI61_11448 [Archangium gephyra]|uniref:Uncharacterized protein n=1 Tax=Archangium gephyra TaxID=48 RepID=A0AAC8Q552_9BACT|nr:hypothetical protein [Archangium gephyra]AKJ01250.1 Hypothetical protein AA314_02876 [Archangium gephyra]REG24440.1 hypothetical protein ATI61_11448 [Archangium gephyra]